MPRLKYKKASKRTHIYIPDRQMKTAVQIENLSKFVQIALDNAADIMAWAILRGYDPTKYNTGRKIEDVVDEFNEKYPLNDLTLKRQGKWPKNSVTKPDLW